MFKYAKYHVLVIGARCAGAATAMLLARRGLRVLAIDRGAYGTDTLSTHALMRGGVLQLHRWGVLPRIVAAGTPALRGATFRYGDAVRAIPLRAEHGLAALYAPRRTVLDRILVDSAREAGAEVHHACALMDLSHDRHGRVRGATILEEDGQCTAVTADLVVGADGAASSVARLVAAPVLRAGTSASALIYGHWSELPYDDYQWYFARGLGAGIIPTNRRQHCVFVAMPVGRYRQAVRDGLNQAYLRMLAETSPSLATSLQSARMAGRLWVFPGRKGFMKQPYGPGWALVGDAGYFKDPLTAHGITDALRDAELLTIAASQGSDDAWRHYAAVRDDLSSPLFEATDAIASFSWTLDGLETLHAALNRAMKREVNYIASLADAAHGRWREPGEDRTEALDPLQCAEDFTP